MPTKKKPSGVCTECGVTANVLTCLARYQAPPDQLMFSVSTFHVGICKYCGEKKELTEERDFFYPDFTLIDRVIKLLNNKD